MTWILGAVLLTMLCESAACSEWHERQLENKEIESCVTRLAGGDADEQRAAAVRITQIGARAVAATARGSARFDDERWTVFATACKRTPHPEYMTYEFAAAVASVPPAHGARLMRLAQDLDPRAGRHRTPNEIRSIVKSRLVEWPKATCTTGNAAAVADLGHAAVPEILSALTRPEIDSNSAFVALSMVASEGEVPALRRLLLSGETRAAMALGRLQDCGSSAAGRTLIDAVSAGILDAHVARALVTDPDRDRVLRAMRRWVSERESISVDQRCALAEVSEAFDATEFAAYAGALSRAGDRAGVELLVAIVATESKPSCIGAGLLLRHGRRDEPICNRAFGVGDRCRAAQLLDEIAGTSARIVASDSPLPPHEPGAEVSSALENALNRASEAAREWWRASKDRLVFDSTTGVWSVTE